MTANQPESRKKRKQRFTASDKAWVKGYACAVAALWSSHGLLMECRELVRSCGPDMIRQLADSDDVKTLQEAKLL